MKHRGSIYFLTLTSSIILVLAIMGLSFGIIQHRRTSRSNEKIDQANIYTQLGIRHALYFTKQAPNWRNLLSSGAWMQDIPNGNAAYTVAGIDMIDGLLDNGDDPVQLACTTTVNGVQRTMTVQTQQPALGLLRYAIGAGGSIKISNHSNIYGNIVSNADITKSGSETIIIGNAEAVGTVSGLTNISGSITTGIEPKTFPYSPSLLDFYKSRATPIMFQSTIEKVLLSPSSNPFGTTNPNGLYMINCIGQKITIKDCRIVGTLILINPKSDSNIKDGINWQPARADFPALIVDGGGIRIKPNQNLDEAASDADFSIPGEPGFGSFTDVYPNLIQGVIYSDGDLILDQSCTIDGAIIVTGNIKLRGNTQINATPTLWESPPQKFYESYLQPVQGTWQEVIF